MILFISNGHGEDSIAAEIIRRLPPGTMVHAYPTLGSGRAYQGVCPLVGPRRQLPSEGNRIRGSLLRDAFAGFGIRHAMHFMRREARAYDAIVVVGDILGVAMCWMSGNRARVYLDVYKSGFANHYSAAERWLIQRSCELVLTRDAILAGQVSNARFAGNVMMDTLVVGDYDARSRRRHSKAVAMLPGSRTAAAANFALQVEALRRVSQINDIDLFVVLAPGLDVSTLAAAGRLTVDGDTLVGQDLLINVSTGSLGAVLEASDIVLGQAGTANLQAIGRGRPVISFRTDGARETRRKRVTALTGASRTLVRPDAATIASELSRLLDDDAERHRRGQLGRERMGPPGAIDAVIAALAG